MITGIFAIWSGKYVIKIVLGPIGGRGVNCCLYIAAIKVDGCERRFVAKGGTSKGVPGKGTRVGDVVDVEAGIDCDGRIVDLECSQSGLRRESRKSTCIIKNITTWRVEIWRFGKVAWRWRKGQISIYVRCIVASV